MTTRRKIGYQRKQLRDEEDLIPCPLDSIPIKDHVRCSTCHILIGSKHHMRTPHTVDGAIICTECLMRREKSQ